ncbi:prepilin-type N-terminal cleavage/methylation domain-containing protein [Tissierellaceae bacterium HCP3S3_D8]
MKKGGYTLLEMIIVLALISILLSLAYPNINFYRRIREKREIIEFKKDLMFARNRAIIESKNYIVYFYHSENRYKIKGGERSSVVKDKMFKYGIRLETTNPIKSFIFKSNGTTLNSDTLYFRDSFNQRYKVTLTPATGRISFSLDNVN